MESCTTCGKPVNQPYTRIVAGQMVEGCVDKAHKPHIVPTTTYAFWFSSFYKRMRAAKRAAA